MVRAAVGADPSRAATCRGGPPSSRAARGHRSPGAPRQSEGRGDRGLGRSVSCPGCRSGSPRPPWRCWPATGRVAGPLRSPRTRPRPRSPRRRRRDRPCPAWPSRPGCPRWPSWRRWPSATTRRSAQAEALIDEQRGLLRQLTRYPNPTAGWLQSTPSQRSEGAVSGAFISQDIVTAGKLRVVGEAERIEIEWRTWQLKAQVGRVVNDVRIRYAEAIGAQHAMDATAELERLAADDLEAIRQLVEARQASRPDLLQAEIHLDALRASLDEARLRHRAAWRNWRTSSASPGLTPVPLSDADRDDPAAARLEGQPRPADGREPGPAGPGGPGPRGRARGPAPATAGRAERQRPDDHPARLREELQRGQHAGLGPDPRC